MRYLARGELPSKHHVAFRDPAGALRWEECFTRDGFDGAYSILYHLHRPHEAQPSGPTALGWSAPVAAGDLPLLKRHLVGSRLSRTGGPPLSTTTPLLFNPDVTLSLVLPDAADPAYRVNADGDDLYFIHEGGGLLRSPFGDLSFGAYDYVYVPRGTPHRFLPDAKVQTWLSIECHGGAGLLGQARNGAGQLRMDAPYCHRDFRPPTFVGPQDEGIRDQVVKRDGRFHAYRLPHSPLDVVGWDGAVWPFAFHILDFQPRAGLVHLPPTWHGTFAARGALICSFVPRVVDFHPEAIPCPYPHSSVDVDEFLYYVAGNFTSRRGVGPGSMSFHPAGLPHGPHPGAYEASIGHRTTNELAVMLDTARPLALTPAALGLDDPNYMASFLG